MSCILDHYFIISLKIITTCPHVSILAEYGAGGQASVVGDAYSFGITLLEMFTGKAPTDNMFREGLSSVIEVGVSCSKENPSERMDMKHAAAKLNRIREVMESSL